MFVVIENNSIVAYSSYCDRLSNFNTDKIIETKFTQEEVDKFGIELNAEGKIVLGTSEIIKCKDTIVNDEIPMTLKELEEENKRLKTQVSAMNDNQTFLEDCIIELAQEVCK